MSHTGRMDDRPKYVPRSAEARGLDQRTADAIDAYVAKVTSSTEPLDETARRRLAATLWPRTTPAPPAPRKRN